MSEKKIHSYLIFICCLKLRSNENKSTFKHKLSSTFVDRQLVRIFDDYSQLSCSRLTGTLVQI